MYTRITSFLIRTEIVNDSINGFAVKPVEEKIVGVIGGLGPEATVDLMRRVIEANPAKDDADHIRMIVDNNPKIPSRCDPRRLWPE